MEMAKENGCMIAGLLLNVKNAARLKGRTAGLTRHRVAGTILLSVFGVCVSAYAVYYAPVMFLTRNLLWNSLAALFTFAGIAIILMPTPDRPLSLPVGKKKRWWMVLAYAADSLAIASPFIAMPLIGFDEALVLILLVIINCALLLGLLLIGMLTHGLIVQDGWKTAPQLAKRP